MLFSLNFCCQSVESHFQILLVKYMKTYNRANLSLVTGSGAHSAMHCCISYLGDDYEVFAGVTHCTDVGEIWHRVLQG